MGSYWGLQKPLNGRRLTNSILQLCMQCLTHVPCKRRASRCTCTTRQPAQDFKVLNMKNIKAVPRSFMASGPPNPGLDEETLDFSGPLGRIPLAATSLGTACIDGARTQDRSGKDALSASWSNTVQSLKQVASTSTKYKLFGFQCQQLFPCYLFCAVLCCFLSAPISL